MGKVSSKYEEIRTWYHLGIWSETMCRNAVIKEWITAEEFKRITGKDY